MSHFGVPPWDGAGPGGTLADLAFVGRYGPWAVIAGASEGLGAAFAEALARRGLHLLLLARRPEPLEALAADLRARFGVEVAVLAVDLGATDVSERLLAEVGAREVGLVVYNAAFAPVGAFLDRALPDLLRVVDVNVRGPLIVSHTLLPAMVGRRRGGLVVMSSMAGLQGSPRLATYAATKAFLLVLAEGLWGELRGQGVDVVVSAAGAIRTPGYAATRKAEAPGTLDASVVAEETLGALGRGPRIIPGWVNTLAAFFTSRLLPRRAAVAIMARATLELS